MSDFGDMIRAYTPAERKGVYALEFLAGVADEQADRVERVLALHTPMDARVFVAPNGGPLQVCSYCAGWVDRFDQDSFPWPCETVRILTGDENV